MANPDTNAPSVAVVGSLNLDIVVLVPHLATPGETVVGGDLFRNPGGKGANQAVAAARLGRKVAMVGRVGDDDAGDMLRAALRKEKVDVSHLFTSKRTPSGIALIAVDERGQNAIVVSPGANHRVAATDVTAATDVLASSDVVLVQLEIPIDAVLAVARAARGTVILNPAPATGLPAELLTSTDVLVPNATELAQIAGTDEPRTVDEAAKIARRIEGPGAVVVTLGAEGALLVEGKRLHHVPALTVTTVDTTAAGDAFCGALADALARAHSLEAAVQWACAAASIATTREGAQQSLPTRPEVDELLASRGG